MVGVASLGLCRELYERSGWKGTDFVYPSHLTEAVYWPKPLQESGLASDYPAYDLGYLLRKLPLYIEGGNLTVCTDGIVSPDWCAYYDATPVVYKYYDSATPEDALVHLGIELFKQGVLTRGGDGTA